MSTDRLKPILIKMCEMVGAEYEGRDFKKDRYYMDFMWDINKEKEFIDWMADYLYKNKEMRNEFEINHSTKKICWEVASAFVLNYGWTRSDYDTV